MEERRALRDLHARADLGGHDPGEVDDLERVLEDVLAVAGAKTETAEDLHEILAAIAPVRLEDRLLARLHDRVLDLRLRRVVRVLDPGGVDPAVLDQLGGGELGDLAAAYLEGT